MSNFIDTVYDIIRKDTENLDSVYEDYIVHMVGISGLNALLEHGLLESCGVVNGRQLYVICERK